MYLFFQSTICRPQIYLEDCNTSSQTDDHDETTQDYKTPNLLLKRWSYLGTVLANTSQMMCNADLEEPS